LHEWQLEKQQHLRTTVKIEYATLLKINIVDLKALPLSNVLNTLTVIEAECRRGLIPEHKIRKPTFHYYQSNHLTVQLAADNPRKCAALNLSFKNCQGKLQPEITLQNYI
jgi:hypothetical protein